LDQVLRDLFVIPGDNRRVASMSLAELIQRPLKACKVIGPKVAYNQIVHLPEEGGHAGAVAHHGPHRFASQDNECI